jgi:5-methylcytosine-specific restriction endonuclease McrA
LARYCPDHAHKQRQASKDYDERRASDPVLRNNAKIRNSQRWRQVRALIIAQNPLCVDPFGEHRRMNRTVSASQVHHIKPLGTHPELAFVADNLMALCTGCHARIERQQSNEVAS